MNLVDFLKVVKSRVDFDKHLLDEGILDKELYSISYAADAVNERKDSLKLDGDYHGIIFDLIENYDISEFSVRYFNFALPRIVIVNNEKYIQIGSCSPELIVLDNNNNVLMLDVSASCVECICATSQDNFLSCLATLIDLDLRRRKGEDSARLYSEGLEKLKLLSGLDLNGSEINDLEKFYGNLLPNFD